MVARIAVLEFENIQGGVMELHHVRAHEHRSMAVVLPFIVHGVLDNTTLGEQCAVSYVQWRHALDKHSYEESADASDSDVGSLSDVKRLGSVLQSNMNSLKAYLAVSDGEPSEFEG